MDTSRHAPLGRMRPRLAAASGSRTRAYAYLDRSGRPLSEIYVSDHADSRQSGRFRWLVSTCMAATVGVLAIFVAITGSMDLQETEGGTLEGLKKRLQEAPLVLRLKSAQVDGLRWAVPKTDKLVIPSGAVAAKSYIADEIKQRRGNREYTVPKYYLRMVARLAPISRTQAQAVPQFDPYKLYGTIGGPDEGSRPDRQREAAVKLFELNGILPSEDGQELDLQEVAALVARAQVTDEEGGAAGGELLAARAQQAADLPAPLTTILTKTVFEQEEAETTLTTAPTKGGRGESPPPGQLLDRDRAGDNSLYASLHYTAAKQGLGDDLILNIMRIHAYETDFRQPVRVGDGVELFFDIKDEERGIDGPLGDLLAAFITSGGQTQKLYRFRTSDGVTDFYDPDGNTARKFLMRRPVRCEDARLTSGFGMRRHPLLQTARMHSGVDWACATGTPIMAAGHGVIEEIGPKGENGNYIRIRHANGYKTAYAHLSRYAQNMAVGVRVRQGQTIGYVGSTGLSSGPHLHFEVMVRQRGENNYTHVDPRTIHVPNDRQLAGKDLVDFKRERSRIDDLMRRHPVSTKVVTASLQ